uniref:Uncharacterized protein n=1 Tax=Trichinella nativa TaxID=6335 RepID=A0A0V1KJE1_9BILA
MDFRQGTPGTIFFPRNNPKRRFQPSGICRRKEGSCRPRY